MLVLGGARLRQPGHRLRCGRPRERGFYLPYEGTRADLRRGLGFVTSFEDLPALARARRWPPRSDPLPRRPRSIPEKRAAGARLGRGGGDGPAALLAARRRDTLLEIGDDRLR